MALETKAALTDETISMLQSLIKINIDSRDGFKDAAEHLDDLTISSFFREMSSQRDQQAAELQALVAANRETPEDSGSIKAAAHRAWMDMRAALGGGTASILSEAERGEDYIKGLYEEALREHPGTAVSDVLHRQFVRVKAAHDRVRDLRDQYQQK